MLVTSSYHPPLFNSEIKNKKRVNLIFCYLFRCWINLVSVRNYEYERQHDNAYWWSWHPDLTPTIPNHPSQNIFPSLVKISLLSSPGSTCTHSWWSSLASHAARAVAFLVMNSHIIDTTCPNHTSSSHTYVYYMCQFPFRLLCCKCIKINNDVLF